MVDPQKVRHGWSMVTGPDRLSMCYQSKLDSAIARLGYQMRGMGWVRARRGLVIILRAEKRPLFPTEDRKSAGLCIICPTNSHAAKVLYGHD